MNILRVFVQKLSKGGENLSMGILFALMLLICGDTIGRYILQKPIPVAIELGEFSMIAMVYLSIAYAQSLKLHVKVELVTARLSPKIQTILSIFTDAVGVCFWALVTYQGAEIAIEVCRYGDVTPGMVPLPLFPAKILIPIGSSLLCIQLLYDISDKVKSILAHN